MSDSSILTTVHDRCPEVCEVFQPRGQRAVGQDRSVELIEGAKNIRFVCEHLEVGRNRAGPLLKRAVYPLNDFRSLILLHNEMHMRSPAFLASEMISVVGCDDGSELTTGALLRPAAARSGADPVELFDRVSRQFDVGRGDVLAQM
jgi:hypothetical protein